jgi:hypothetical protein
MSLYQDIVLADRPALYLPMNEASGPFIDLTGNGYDASITGAITRNSTAFTVDGKGGAVSTGGFAVAEKGLLPFGDSWTIELWMGSSAAASWFDGNTGLSWIVSFPGDLVRQDGTRNNVAGVLYYFYYPGGYTALSVQVCDMLYSQLVTTERDDANNYVWNNTGSFWLQQQQPLNSVRRHIVLRKPSGLADASRPNPTQNLCPVFSNNAYVGQTNGSGPPPAIRPAISNGLGLFGRPTGPQTIYGGAAQTTWLSNVAMYDYCLTDAQINRHYLAGTTGAIPATNRVAGSTLLDGFAVGGFPVTVHRRDTGAVLGKTVSDGSGAFSCNVGTYSGQVYAVCHDTVSGNSFPAQVFDLIIPSI